MQRHSMLVRAVRSSAMSSLLRYICDAHEAAACSASATATRAFGPYPSSWDATHDVPQARNTTQIYAGLPERMPATALIILQRSIEYLHHSITNCTDHRLWRKCCETSVVDAINSKAKCQNTARAMVRASEVQGLGGVAKGRHPQIIIHATIHAA
jgi:hypothetical protein